LQQYERAFRENAIDVSILAELTNSDLDKIGVLLGHRKDSEGDFRIKLTVADTLT
jgi:hypothetical protein